MFYLRGRGNGGHGSPGDLSAEDDFGWWLSDASKSVTSGSEKSSRSGSASSMLSCVDSDDPENYALARDFGDESEAAGRSCEKIELPLLAMEDLDVDLIEKDAADKETLHLTPFKTDDSGRPSAKPRPQNRRGACYTPERLVRTQEYRILTPSPRYLSIPQVRLIQHERETSKKARRCRRRLSYLIDSKQIGANQLKVLLNLRSPNILISNAPRNKCEMAYEERVQEKPTSETSKDSLEVENQQSSIDTRTPSSISKRSSYERLNATWEEVKNPKSHSSSLEDTSGIQSNDWSSDTHSETHNPPLCLCDELAIASANCRHTLPQERRSSINEVVSILETLETDPDRAAVLLEEDRFCDSSSPHDRLTRLALTIETDANVPGAREDPERVVVHLQKKVEKLQLASKDIYKDICNLRKNFQHDEKKMADISSNTLKLREDVNEMRYLDDLLNLLRGELERISKRNWPFVLGHTEFHAEEMNLIV